MAKYLGKAGTAKAAATNDNSTGNKPTTPPTMVKAAATTSKAPAQDIKAQADLMAKLMAQVEEQSKKLAALKASF